MSLQWILDVQDVSKSFRSYAGGLNRIASWFGMRSASTQDNWVVQNVSFRMRPGECLGIVGHNGAGKSTLLKMITGTLKPTSGRVMMAGRVSALLELGLGFNPELTGRQNAIHVCGLMGLSQERLSVLINEIADFAEIGEYFDQPIRVYSSGMQMRLAFSVATVVRPDLLIVDEALSVGDAYFVHKCFDRIRSFRELGTSLLIVSHDPAAIQSLCERAILLERGRLIMDGEPQAVLDFYNALIAQKENEKANITVQSTDGGGTESGNRLASIERVELVDENGVSREVWEVGSKVRLRTVAKISGEIDQLVWGYLIKDRLGQHMFGTNTYHKDLICKPSIRCRVEFHADFQLNLGPGSYSISIALTGSQDHLAANYHWRDLALVFSVVNPNEDYFIGCAWLDSNIELMEITSD